MPHKLHLRALSVQGDIVAYVGFEHVVRHHRFLRLPIQVPLFQIIAIVAAQVAQRAGRLRHDINGQGGGKLGVHGCLGVHEKGQMQSLGMPTRKQNKGIQL